MKRATKRASKKRSATKTVASYSFYSKDLNSGKFESFLQKAISIRDFKNALSAEISSNLLKYADLNKFDLMKMFAVENGPISSDPRLRGNERQKAVEDVCDAYENKIKQVKQKMTFGVQKEIVVTKYKRNTKHHKKQDVRSYEVVLKSTPLTKSLAFLAKHGSESTSDYVSKCLSDVDLNLNKRAFYLKLLEQINKFGLDRLLKLALSKRHQILRKYGNPIIFKSLSYRAAIQTQGHLLENSENKSFCNAFVCIPSFDGTRGNDMYVPTSFNINHHGHLNQYTTREYIVCVEEKRQRIRVIVTKEVDVVISPEGTEYIGVDTNIKHNLFSTSEGTEIDLDRDLFRDYVGFLKKFQSKKEHSQGEEELKELWEERVSCMLKRKARELVDHAIAQGKDHIIMEDLSSFARSFVRSEEFEGFKYSRITRLLNLSSLNKIVKGICKKLRVRLTLIPSHYTSQWCFDCGHIDRANRTSQEHFQCVCCGKAANADFHSAQAILRIGSSDVLKRSVLVRDASFDWVPKGRLSKSTIRKQLEDIIP
jgi:transposase